MCRAYLYTFAPGDVTPIDGPDEESVLAECRQVADWRNLNVFWVDLWGKLWEQETHRELLYRRGRGVWVEFDPVYKRTI